MSCRKEQHPSLSKRQETEKEIEREPLPVEAGEDVQKLQENQIQFQNIILSQRQSPSDINSQQLGSVQSPLLPVPREHSPTQLRQSASEEDKQRLFNLSISSINSLEVSAISSGIAQLMKLLSRKTLKPIRKKHASIFNSLRQRVLQRFKHKVTHKINEVLVHVKHPINFIVLILRFFIEQCPRYARKLLSFNQNYLIMTVTCPKCGIRRKHSYNLEKIIRAFSKAELFKILKDRKYGAHLFCQLFNDIIYQTFGRHIKQIGNETRPEEVFRVVRLPSQSISFLEIFISTSFRSEKIPQLLMFLQDLRAKAKPCLFANSYDQNVKEVGTVCDQNKAVWLNQLTSPPGNQKQIYFEDVEEILRKLQNKTSTNLQGTKYLAECSLIMAKIVKNNIGQNMNDQFWGFVEQKKILLNTAGLVYSEPRPQNCKQVNGTNLIL